MNSEHCIDICNRLLRGERSAVETYDLAIGQSDSPSILNELTRIRGEHSVAVDALVDNVRSMGGEPDQEAGAWGIFANSVQGTANVLGQGLKSLETGEKSGKSDYEDALNDQEVMTECKDLIRSRLLPRVEEHISTLERLQRTA